MRRDIAAADKLTDARQDEIHQITDVDGVEAGQAGGAPVDRKKQLTPAQGSEPERQKPEQHRKDDESPAAGP